MSSNPQSLIFFLELCLFKTFLFSSLVSSHLISCLFSSNLKFSSALPSLLSSCLFLTHVVMFLLCFIFVLFCFYSFALTNSLISPPLTSFFLSHFVSTFFSLLICSSLFFCFLSGLNISSNLFSSAVK